jgi:sugar phosphate isomerase/epimerase
MRIGIDARHAPWPAGLSPVGQVEEAAQRGLEGLFFRTLFDMSPTLDAEELKDIRAAVDAKGMYLEAGLGLVNPYALPESPAIRAVGDGDTLLGFRRMIEAAAAIGVTELWVSTAGHKPYGGRFGYDRYRTDVSWGDQLLAIEKFLHQLAPIARDHGVHLNAETHEEITSFELVRLITSVGPDVLGITYDTGNPVQRAEHPRLVTERVAPYVRQTHIKDVALFFDAEGIRTQSRPVGQGVVPVEEVLTALQVHCPQVNLSLESTWSPGARPPAPAPRAPGIALYDPVWVEGHPDLTVSELAEYLGLVQGFADRVERGEVPSFQAVEALPVTREQTWDWIEQSVAHLRSVLDRQAREVALA